MSSLANPQVTWSLPPEPKPEGKGESFASQMATTSIPQRPINSLPLRELASDSSSESDSDSSSDPTKPKDILIAPGFLSRPRPDTPHQPMNEAFPSTPTTGTKRPASNLPITFKTRQPSRLDSTDFQEGWLRRKHEASDRLRNENIWLDYHSGDIFNAQPRTLLIQACNSEGKWGAGIALEFKKRYPQAYGIYNVYCKHTWDPKTKPVPPGSALLIPPVDGQGHWIGCLFTSARVGRNKDRQNKIMWNTISAIQDLLQLVENVDAEAEPGQESEIGDLRMCKINSGKFGVPWGISRGALRGRTCLPYWRLSIEVWVREGEEDEEEGWTIHKKGKESQVKKSRRDVHTKHAKPEERTAERQQLRGDKKDQDEQNRKKQQDWKDKQGQDEQSQKKEQAGKDKHVETVDSTSIGDLVRMYRAQTERLIAMGKPVKSATMIEWYKWYKKLNEDRKIEKRKETNKSEPVNLGMLLEMYWTVSEDQKANMGKGKEVNLAERERIVRNGKTVTLDELSELDWRIELGEDIDLSQVLYEGKPVCLNDLCRHCPQPMCAVHGDGSFSRPPVDKGKDSSNDKGKQYTKTKPAAKNKIVDNRKPYTLGTWVELETRDENGQPVCTNDLCRFCPQPMCPVHRSVITADKMKQFDKSNSVDKGKGKQVDDDNAVTKADQVTNDNPPCPGPECTDPDCRAHGKRKAIDGSEQVDRKKCKQVPQNAQVNTAPQTHKRGPYDNTDFSNEWIQFGPTLQPTPLKQPATYTDEPLPPRLLAEMHKLRELNQKAHMERLAAAAEKDRDTAVITGRPLRLGTSFERFEGLNVGAKTCKSLMCSDPGCGIHGKEG